MTSIHIKLYLHNNSSCVFYIYSYIYIKFEGGKTRSRSPIDCRLALICLVCLRFAARTINKLLAEGMHGSEWLAHFWWLRFTYVSACSWLAAKKQSRWPNEATLWTQNEVARASIILVHLNFLAWNNMQSIEETDCFLKRNVSIVVRIWRTFN